MNKFPLDAAIKAGGQDNLILFKARNNRVNNAELLAPCAGIPVLFRILNGMERRIRNRRYKIHAELREAFGKMFDIVMLPREPYVHPFLWMHRRRFILEQPAKDYGCSVAHVYHHTINQLKDKTKEEICKTYFGQLVGRDVVEAG